MPPTVVEKFYRPGRYDDLWFRWEGKPLMLCNPDAASQRCVNISPSAPPSGPGTPPYKKHTQCLALARRPSAILWFHPRSKGSRADQCFPCTEHALETGALELMWTGKARGRGFSKGKQNSSLEAIQSGRNISGTVGLCPQSGSKVHPDYRME